MRKKTFIRNIFIVLAILFVFVYQWECKFPFDTTRTLNGKTEFGALHILVSLLIFILALIIVIITFIKLDDNHFKLISENKYLEADDKSESFSFSDFSLRNIIIILFIGLLGYFLNSSYKSSKVMYNKSVIYHNNIKQVDQQKKVFYENLWATYSDKRSINDMNKDMFITISKIIMENRKDGSNLAWKWVKENQDIPFSEFTRFYADLSRFIEDQRNEYYLLEVRRSEIANANNVLLDTLPNVIYNKIIGCEKINYETNFQVEPSKYAVKYK